MATTRNALLDAILDSWDRNNTILVMPVGRDRERMVEMPHESRAGVRQAVRTRIGPGRAMDRH